MSRILKISGFLVALIVIAACTGGVAPKIYTESNCIPPCWNKIVPGLSDMNSVRATLQKLPTVNQLSPHNAEEPEPSNGFVFYRILIDGGELSVRLKNEKVVSLYIHDKSNETVNDVIGQVGPPETVYAEYEGAENIDLVIFLLYPSKGVYYMATDKPQASPLNTEDRIEGNMLITEAAFVTPGSVQSMFVALGQKEGLGQCIAARMQPWHGLGLIKVIPIGTPC